LCNLASALLQKGDINGAIRYYLSGLALSPERPAAQFNLANALLRKGRTEEAISHYEKALQLQPDNPDAYTNLGNAFLQKGRVQDAIAQHRNALRIAPEHVAAQVNLAWLLATSPDPSLRDGPEAVALAEQARRLTNGKQPIVLRILAAAYAETGRFPDAIETAKEALQLARAQNNSVLMNELPKDIVLYESGSAYRKK
jgi:protein O-mannosyl-transferase